MGLVISLLSIEGLRATSPSVNGFLRKLHRLRYKK